ncbi:MAG TPA: VanZ family protein [Candidatus Limnocylindrales bacterium]|nr:VanZ family protein [Candidatus Limnocylindrales bacterium]
MPFKITSRIHSWVITGSCFATLTIILVAGLWPFRSPRNDVTWLNGENGIQLGRFGCIFSSAGFRDHESREDPSGSLEVWIKAAPLTKGRRTILAFEGPGEDSASFSLQQNGNTVIVQRKNLDGNGVLHTAEFAVREVLGGGSPVAITVTLGSHDTNVYRNGTLAGASRMMGQSTPAFAGRVMLGNSLKVGGAWPGQYYGLAIYNRKLTPEEVALHFGDWSDSRRSELAQRAQPAALYLFTEHAGSVVHEELGSQNNLMIPERYLVLHPEFLTLPWRHFRSTPGYWEDVAINVLGFVPLGLSFFAYFSTVRATRNAALLVVLLGFLTSLAIEILQAWLPTRNSGMNDLVTNTFGTGLGVLLYRAPLTRMILGR